MIYIGVVGGNTYSRREEAWAEETGRELARRGIVVLCGGRGGVMEAVARGVRSQGGLVVGILPGTTREEGNPYLSLALATGLGNARNAVIACAADGLIAIGGEYGTLSEIALGLKFGRPVASLGDCAGISSGDLKGVFAASNPLEAIEYVLQRLKT
ncbi:TIGR00725 family protein [Desulforudis sp. 1088]|uniref:TIGR00725 family protein n=1 Tax=unclassified Candidatus Desulforudis TaxID=2635950 RepID=UPI003CE51373